MEILVSLDGVSAHESAPERGDKAIFKMAPILLELQDLHLRLKDDFYPFYIRVSEATPHWMFDVGCSTLNNIAAQTRRSFI